MERILIIDDDPTLRLIISKVLERQGYEVLDASNGIQGMELMLSQRPALVVCDWMMPGMDGLEVCQRVKSHPELASTFFILLTARGSIADRVKGLETGADEFLGKPVDSTELQSRVKAGLRIHQANQKLQALANDLQAQKLALETELKEAADYVMSLLPPPLAGPVTIQSYFAPSKQLGGDCFNYLWVDDQRYLIFYLLDVSGHGVRSALISVSIYNLLQFRAADLVDRRNPQQVLELLNSSFVMEQQSDHYFTIWYGVYDRETRELTYGNAGHPPGILVRSSETASSVPTEQLAAGGIPIGFWPDATFTPQTCTVAPGDTVFIFSDGLYELLLADGSVWGVDNFEQLLLAYQQQPSTDLPDLLNQIKQLTGVDQFEDDCAILELHFQ